MSLYSRLLRSVIYNLTPPLVQGKKFKDKAHTQKEHPNLLVPDTDFNLSDNEGALVLKSDQNPVTWLKRPADGAGDGFVTSIRGLFNNQRRKAKAFVLRTMRGEADGDFPGDWSDTEAEFSPFARQLTITKAKKLIRRHTKKFQARQKGISPISQLSFFFYHPLLSIILGIFILSLTLRNAMSQIHLLNRGTSPCRCPQGKPSHMMKAILQAAHHLEILLNRNSCSLSK